jgi:hypothetical protein
VERLVAVASMLLTVPGSSSSAVLAAAHDGTDNVKRPVDLKEEVAGAFQALVCSGPGGSGVDEVKSVSGDKVNGVQLHHHQLETLRRLTVQRSVAEPDARLVRRTWVVADHRESRKRFVTETCEEISQCSGVLETETPDLVFGLSGYVDDVLSWTEENCGQSVAFVDFTLEPRDFILEPPDSTLEPRGLRTGFRAV